MDKKMLVGDISSLSVADKARISSIVDNLQIRDRGKWVENNSVAERVENSNSMMFLMSDDSHLSTLQISLAEFYIVNKVER
ncbi:hypothetical protein OROGR_027748 [Orobanche gracilis]